MSISADCLVITPYLQELAVCKYSAIPYVYWKILDADSCRSIFSGRGCRLGRHCDIIRCDMYGLLMVLDPFRKLATKEWTLFIVISFQNVSRASSVLITQTLQQLQQLWVYWVKRMQHASITICPMKSYWAVTYTHLNALNPSASIWRFN